MAAFPVLRTLLHNAPGLNCISTFDSSKFVLVTNICDEFSDLFALGLGNLAKYEAHIFVKPDV